jgi:hypothetical protein
VGSDWEKKKKLEKGNICDKTAWNEKDGEKKNKVTQRKTEVRQKKAKSHEGNAKWEKKRNCSNGSLEPMF